MKRLAVILMTMMMQAALANGSPMPGRDLLSSTGHVAADGDCDGFVEAGVGNICNPAGYVEIHHRYWWLNARWVLNDGYGPGLLGGLPGIEDDTNGGFGYPWSGFWWSDFGIEGGPSSNAGYFGTEDDPQTGGGFGIGGNPVPEPSSIALFLIGVVAALFRRRTGRRLVAPAAAATAVTHTSRQPFRRSE